MTRETNFSEATFVFPAERAGTDIRLRIFGRGGEMPFAGHPVIGSTFALADDGVIAAGTKAFTFGLNIGPTLVELEWNADRLAFAWMTQQPPAFGATLPDPARLAAAYGLPADALLPDVPVQEVNCGSAFFMLALKTRAAVDQAAIDARAVGAVFEAAGITRRGVFMFSPEPGADGATVYSRMIGADGRRRDGIGQRAAGRLSGPPRHCPAGAGRSHRQRAGREDEPSQPHPRAHRRGVAGENHARAGRRHERPRGGRAAEGLLTGCRRPLPIANCRLSDSSGDCGLSNCVIR